MKVAIMQPYLLPYLGYFQLAASVDAFWLFDCVAFSRRSWMNRNNILVNGQRHQFSVPVSYADRDQKIVNINFDHLAERTVSKLIKTFSQAYRGAVGFDDARGLLESLETGLRESTQSKDPNFTSIVATTLGHSFDAMGMSTPIYRTSTLDLDPSLKAADRILAACRKIGATDYVNMIGGKDLYDVATFADQGIRLSFLVPSLLPYPQHNSKAAFEPGLSVLDVVANNRPNDRAKLLEVQNVGS